MICQRTSATMSPRGGACTIRRIPQRRSCRRRGRRRCHRSERMVLLRTMRLDKIVPAMTRYVEEALGSRCVPLWGKLYTQPVLWQLV